MVRCSVAFWGCSSVCCCWSVSSCGGRLDGIAAFQRRPAGCGRAAKLPAAGDEPRVRRRFAPAGRTRRPSGASSCRITAIPDIVKQAFVSAEDQNFWTPSRRRSAGDRPRAALTDLMQWARAGGRSAPPRSPSRSPRTCCWTTRCRSPRKVKEAILAIRIEQTLTKDRILELYLNEIYLGLGSYGVAAAAQAYFNKPLDQLTLPRPRSSRRCPRRRTTTIRSAIPMRRAARRDWVLDRMAEDHVITPAQAAQAKGRRRSCRRRSSGRDRSPGADWFAEEVRRQLIDAVRRRTRPPQGGLMVRTSLDPVLQAAADKALRDGLMAYDRSMGGWRGPVTHLDGGARCWRRTGRRRWPRWPRPPGMLPDWRLAVVLDDDRRRGQARLARPRRATPAAELGAASCRCTCRHHLGAAGRTTASSGPTPRRMTDVVQVGDVVMVEPSRPARRRPPRRRRPTARRRRRPPASG